MSRAGDAVAYVLRRIQSDGRVAYLLGYGTETFERLTAAYIDEHPEEGPLDKFRASFWKECAPRKVIEAEAA